MTKRLQYPTYWASGGTATDPDLDTTAPSYEANKYEQHGWKSEKPPEQWQNFLSQITDEKVIARIIDGIQEKDASVTYQNGSVFRDSDKFYVMEGGVAKEILSVERAAYQSFITNMNNLLSNHLAADNPHQDTVNTLIGGGYEKGAVDAFFGSPTDPNTIVYHKLQMGAAVHETTAAQLNTLTAAAGGNFTGDVIFLNNALVQVTPSKYIHYNRATALLEIVNGTYSMGVDANGNGYIVGTGGMSVMLSEGNLNFLTIKINNSFALPCPYLSMNVELDIFDADSIGIWTLDTVETPAVHVDGKGLDVSQDLTFQAVTAPSDHTIVIRGVVGGADTVLVKDYVGGNTWATLSDIMTEVSSGTTLEYLKQLTLFPTLSARQKTMLVTK